MTTWLLFVALLQPGIPGRTYWPVSLEKLATTKRTHVCVTGPVVYRRKMKDGDWHVTLDDGKGRAVLEIIPLIPLPAPKKGQTVTACGIRRIDEGHGGWVEIHPVESLEVRR